MPTRLHSCECLLSYAIPFLFKAVPMFIQLRDKTFFIENGASVCSLVFSPKSLHTIVQAHPNFTCVYKAVWASKSPWLVLYVKPAADAKQDKRGVVAAWVAWRASPATLFVRSPAQLSALRSSRGKKAPFTAQVGIFFFAFPEYQQLLPPKHATKVSADHLVAPHFCWKKSRCSTGIAFFEALASPPVVVIVVEPTTRRALAADAAPHLRHVSVTQRHPKMRDATDEPPRAARLLAKPVKTSSDDSCWLEQYRRNKEDPVPPSSTSSSWPITLPPPAILSRPWRMCFGSEKGWWVLSVVVLRSACLSVLVWGKR